MKMARGDSRESLAILKEVPISIVQWMDNKDVVLASTYVGKLPENTAKRWNRTLREHIEVSRPHCIQEYNKFMGGVDLSGSHIGRNRIRMKSRKYYMRMFYHILDTAIVNCWLLFKKKNPSVQLTLPQYRRELAYALLTIDKKIWCGRGRPPIEGPMKKARKIVPPIDVRQEGNHVAHFSNVRGRCKYGDCNGVTFIECINCRVNLCINKKNNCFCNFHYPISTCFL